MTTHSTLRKGRVLLSAAFVSSALLVNAQTPFPTGTAVVLAKQGQNSAAPNYTLYTTTTPAVGTSFTPGVTINFAPRNVNGIGLNAADKLLYGAGYSDNGTPTVLTDDSRLFRIGADGAYVDLGALPVTGLGAAIPIIGGTAELVNFSAGTVVNGAYVYPTIALKASGVSKLSSAALFGTPLNLNANDIRIFIAQVDNVAALTTMPATPSSYYELNFSNAQVTAGVNGFLQDMNNNYNNTPGGMNEKLAALSYSNGGFQDIAINPTNGLLYTYISYQDPTPESPFVDVVGFPVVASASGVVTPISSTINENPSQEVAGLGFDAAGNLFSLFTSGEYGQINLTTGVVDNIVTSNIPTATYNGQPHLRGDYAQPLPLVDGNPLPVEFTSVAAFLNNNALTVNWSTASETNNDHFDIEVSKDGKTFSKVATVASKATIGNNTNLSYTHSIERSALQAGLLSLSLLGFIGFAGFKRRSYKLLAMGVVAVASMGLYSCSKSDVTSTNSTSSFFVRIAQVDKDGKTSYSKTVRVAE